MIAWGAGCGASPNATLGANQHVEPSPLSPQTLVRLQVYSLSPLLHYTEPGFWYATALSAPTSSHLLTVNGSINLTAHALFRLTDLVLLPHLCGHHWALRTEVGVVGLNPKFREHLTCENSLLQYIYLCSLWCMSCVEVKYGLANVCTLLMC